jgi:cell division protein FtsW
MKIIKTKSDIFLVTAVILLLTIGIIMVFSASAVVAHEKHGSLIYYLQKQLLWGFICLIAIFISSRVKLSLLSKRGLPLATIIFSIFLLCGLFLWGDLVNGARRWYNLGLASFQPSELAKIALVFYFADVLSRKGVALRDWKKGLLPHVVIFIAVVVPIFYQPDLGTVVMITLIISTMIFLSNVRFKHILAGFIFLLPALLLRIQNSTYQFARLKTWYENLFNPLGSGYQIKQSLIGLGRGGLFGTGIGTSKQKFYFLPDSHTDFVFSILGEELGFIGTTFILILFLIILWRGISIAKHANSSFAQYLGVGLTMNLVLYGFINAAVVTMLFPTTGIPMPFLSYGGSSLLMVGISVGILINIAKHNSQNDYNNRIDQLQKSQRSFYNTLIVSSKHEL